MTWQAIESKLLSAVAYDAEHSILYLRFRDSGDVYCYCEFIGRHGIEALSLQYEKICRHQGRWICS